MKEIGGYLELEENKGQEYYKDCLKINTGRNCLRYIIRSKNITSIYLPYYICEAVINVCIEEKCAVKYYHIAEDFKPILSEDIDRNEYIYIVNYYGQISNDYILNLKKIFSNIIFDNAQAFFSMPVSDVDTIYTCRKFFGVPDGAYLFTNCGQAKLNNDFSYNRMLHLYGRYEKSASEFFNDYQVNEEIIEKLPLLYMSKVTCNILKGINYEYIKNKRTDNFAYLHNKLKSYNNINVNVVEGAFMYPFLIQGGNELREKLIRKKIYIPTFWKNVLLNNDINRIERNLAYNLVCLPCDQRYSNEDMEYLYKSIADCIIMQV